MRRRRGETAPTIERRVAGAAAGMALANAGALGAYVAAVRLLGVERVLCPGSWRESDLFAAIVVVCVGLAGAAGGAVCGAIARRAGVVAAMSVILLGWWGVEGALQVGAWAPGAGEARVPSATVVDGAREGLISAPTWSVLASPVAIGIGALVGGWRVVAEPGISPCRVGARGRARAFWRRP